MDNEKIKLEINVPKKEYKKVKEYIDHIANSKKIDKLLHDDISIENFIIGSIRREIENIENLNEVFCELKTRGYVRPIKLKTNFKEILKTMGLKQLDLESMTGIGGSDISNYMNDRRLMSLDHFLRIWIALGCPNIDRIFYVENKRKK